MLSFQSQSQCQEQLAHHLVETLTRSSMLMKPLGCPKSLRILIWFREIFLLDKGAKKIPWGNMVFLADDAGTTEYSPAKDETGQHLPS